MPTLIEAIKADRTDGEFVAHILETLRHACFIDEKGPDKGAQGKANVDSLVQKPEIMQFVLTLMEETDRKIQFETSKLITVLMAMRRDEVQAAVLQSPMGIPRLVDLLEGPELIRNEGLLLLKELTKKNVEIAKVIVFSGAFEMLFDIIRDEGAGNGGIVVIDCLHVIHNLLKDNALTANHFRENGCIMRLAPLLQLEDSDVWILSEDKSEVLAVTLDILAALVTACNPQDAYSTQSTISQQGILGAVLRLALSGINSPVVRSKALWTCGHLIRGHPENCVAFQESTFAVLKQGAKHQHALLRVLTILNTSTAYKERRAALFLFECYLHDNNDAQIALASTLTPPPDESAVEEESVGRVVVRFVLKWETERDPTKVWFACLLLSAILSGNKTAKEFALRIQLEIDDNASTTENLLSRALRSAVKAIKTKADILVQVGFLKLICVWVFESPNSIKAFLHSTSTMQVASELMQQRSSALIHVNGLFALACSIALQHEVTFAQSFKSLVDNKIGSEKLIEALTLTVKTDEFVNAEKSRALMALEDLSKPMLYDYYFTQFYRSLQQGFIAALQPGQHGGPVGTVTSSPSGGGALLHNESESLKALIREQDQKLREYELKLQQMQADQSRLLSSGGNGSKELVDRLNRQTEELREKEFVIGGLRSRVSMLESHGGKGNEKELEQLRAENKQLLLDLQTSKSKNSLLKQKLNLAEQKSLDLSAALMKYERSGASLSAVPTVNSEKLKQLEDLVASLSAEKAAVQGELDELLVVLAEQSREINGYRTQLGLPVEDDDADNDTASPDFT